MKKVKYIFIIPVICFLLFWAGAIIKCEILTYLHGTEFTTLYKETHILGEQEYLKVLNYSDTSARVYYVGIENRGGAVLLFVKKDGQWTFDKWGREIWSKSGSADGFVWPYIR